MYTGLCTRIYYIRWYIYMFIYSPDKYIVLVYIYIYIYIYWHTCMY